MPEPRRATTAGNARCRPRGPAAPWVHGVALGAILAAVASVFGQVGGFGFLNLDDDGYVTENAAVRAGLTEASVRWAFTHFE